jgi:hypothetical protein
VARTFRNGVLDRLSIFVGFEATSRRSEIADRIVEKFRYPDEPAWPIAESEGWLSTLPPSTGDGPPFILDVSITRIEGEDEATRFFLRLLFSPQKGVGAYQAKELASARAGGRTIEAFMGAVADLVGGEEAFSIVRVEGMAEADPPMRLPFAALDGSGGRLQPFGVRYKAATPGTILDVRWNFLEEQPLEGPEGGFAFTIRYGMMDKWVDPKPWETERVRALEHLASVFPT